MLTHNRGSSCFKIFKRQTDQEIESLAGTSSNHQILQTPKHLVSVCLHDNELFSGNSMQLIKFFVRKEVGFNLKKRDQTDAIYGGKDSRLKGSVPVLVHQLNWQKILVENKIKLTFFLFNDKKMKFSSDLISCNMGQFEVFIVE